MKKTLLITIAALLCSFALSGRVYTVSSPSGSLKLSVSAGEQLVWSLSVDDAAVIENNRISMTIDETKLGVLPRVTGVKKGSVSEHIVAPFYRQAEFDTKYNWLTLKMKGDWSLELRAYDDGVAYRLVTNKPDIRKITEETVEFNFAQPYGMLVPYAKFSKGDSYRTSFESLYEEVKAGDMTTADGRLAFMPVYINLEDRGRLLLMESDLFDYPGMFLRTTEKGFVAEFPPYPENEQVQNAKYLDYLNVVKGSRTFPWRVIAYGKTDMELPVNNMVYQLASPCRLDDVSWISAGQSSWDWWNAFRRHGVDFKAGINTETYLYDIDFAAKFGIRYILLDEGWYKNKNIFTTVDEIDIPRICAHAAEKGVGVILWVSKGVLGLKPEKAFKHYSEMGVSGFKIDFFDSQEAAMVGRITRYAEAAAKYHLVIDFHGIYKPVGLNRTYPNVLNFEGVYGLENMKWCNPDRCDMPRNDVILPYIRQAAGQMDYTPGALRNATRKDFRAVSAKPMSQGTRAHQLACYVVFDAPLQMLCDSPSDYLREEETTRWIASIPTVFDSTTILSGKTGEWILTLREKSGSYYLGAMTSWTARDIPVDFSFLPEGEWNCCIFRDGVNADTVAEDYVVDTFKVSSSDSRFFHLAQGGGFVMIIKK